MSGLQPFAFLVGWDLGLRPRLVYYAPLALRQNDGLKWRSRFPEGVTYELKQATAKCGGPSTAAAKYAASGRDDGGWGVCAALRLSG